MNRDLLHDWRQSGLICVWRYVDNLGNYPGWHFAADADGFVSLIDLLESFTSQPGDPSRFRTIQISQPTAALLAVPNNPYSSIIVPEKLRVASSYVCHAWTVTQSESHLVITIGRDQCDSIIGWLRDPERAFDTSFGEPTRLWFWGIVAGSTR
jgi:hypothetical protein